MYRLLMISLVVFQMSSAFGGQVPPNIQGVQDEQEEELVNQEPNWTEDELRAEEEARKFLPREYFLYGVYGFMSH